MEFSKDIVTERPRLKKEKLFMIAVYPENTNRLYRASTRVLLSVEHEVVHGRAV